MKTHCGEKQNTNITTMTANKETSNTLSVRAMVHLAAKTIAPVWPLKTFIACNSLHGFESQPFEVALNEAELLFNTSAVDYQDINRETIKWCGIYFDEGQSTINMPSKKESFYAAFKALAQYDRMLHQKIKANKQWLKSLPEHAEEAILMCLKSLQVPEDEHVFFLKKSLAQLSGWSGYIKWQTEWKRIEDSSNLLVDFIAVRLIITVLLHPKIHFSAYPLKTVNQKSLMGRIVTLEENYKSRLVRPLLEAAKLDQVSTLKSPDAQLVFCIDVRSEPFRRQLESLGNYQTFGFAGFFGLPIRLHDYNTGKITDSCPVLLKPRYDVHDKPIEAEKKSQKKHDSGQRVIHTLTSAYQTLKYNFATPFALAETLGAWCGLLMMSKTFQPVFTISTLSHMLEKIMPSLKTAPVIEMRQENPDHGIPSTDQALYAEAVLRMIGLTEHFGKFVIFCGHGSSTQNNPYASGLDCGACGGNHGGGNAKVLAEILNQASIRSVLSERGIYIPQHTQFLAAEHNTTTDEMVVFNAENAPHLKVLAKLKRDLESAKEKNTATRIKDFNLESHVDSIKETQRRSQDWSEVRPEWGLARNAAFIVGPRKITEKLNLEGRCFLHSYEWYKDEQLTSLETILTAPMVVAQWINTQYLFSTIDNVNYGSGSKITQNVTGKIGIMQGNGSDLMHGLPLQSVYAKEDQNYHQPQRLLTIVYAPRKNVSTIIERQEILKTLFFNAWVHLIVIEPKENQAYQLETTGEWCLITNIGEKNDRHSYATNEQ